LYVFVSVLLPIEGAVHQGRFDVLVALAMVKMTVTVRSIVTVTVIVRVKIGGNRISVRVWARVRVNLIYLGHYYQWQSVTIYGISKTWKHRTGEYGVGELISCHIELIVGLHIAAC
jgi:hypothetical protein